MALALVVMVGGACLGAAGCSFAAGDPPSRFSCGEGDACPSGTTCIDGYCEVGPDELDAGGTCHDAEFGSSTMVGGISSLNDDWSPIVTEDGLEIFVFRPVAVVEIYRGERDSEEDDDFRDAGRAFEMMMAAADRDPAPSADGLTMFFASTRGGSLGGHDLWMASRQSRDQAFEQPEHLDYLSSLGEERSPWLSVDGRRLYFASTRAGDFDIYLAERVGMSAQFSEPQPVSSLNSDSDDRWIRLTPDELEAFVTSERRGGAGGHDLYRCRRDQPTGPFGPCANMEALNTAFDDVAAAPSRDGRELYMNLDTNLDGGRDADVWRATRDCGP